MKEDNLRTAVQGILDGTVTIRDALMLDQVMSQGDDWSSSWEIESKLLEIEKQTQAMRPFLESQAVRLLNQYCQMQAKVAVVDDRHLPEFRYALQRTYHKNSFVCYLQLPAHLVDICPQLSFEGEARKDKKDAQNAVAYHALIFMNQRGMLRDLTSSDDLLQVVDQRGLNNAIVLFVLFEKKSAIIYFSVF